VAGGLGAAIGSVCALTSPVGFFDKRHQKGARMAGATNDVWEVMSTARTIRRFTDEPVDDATLARCLQAATWAPSGANAQAWRFVVLRSPEQRAVVAKAAARALEVIEPVDAMSRPATTTTAGGLAATARPMSSATSSCCGTPSVCPTIGCLPGMSWWAGPRAGMDLFVAARWARS
jgi:nitroreductase